METWLVLLVFALGIMMAIAWLRLNKWRSQNKTKNPFEKDGRQARRAYIHNQRERDAVIKQGFSRSKVPEQLDAVVIGSGMGGLTTAAIMAKMGRRVLVLEQHDQAGGAATPS